MNIRKSKNFTEDDLKRKMEQGMIPYQEDLFGEKKKVKVPKKKVIVTAISDMKYKVTSPVMIKLPRKTQEDRRVYLNLNTYRNLHYQVNNLAKKEYKKHMRHQIEQLPVFGKIRLLFILHRGSKRTGDRHNVCSIVQKFFCDALVEFGKLQDDTDEFIISEKYETGDIDKGYAHCKIYIKEAE